MATVNMKKLNLLLRIFTAYSQFFLKYFSQNEESVEMYLSMNNNKIII